MSHPAFQQPHALGADYASWLIQKRADELVGRYGFTESDRRDIEQELTLDLLQRWDNYDPSRAKPVTFIARVVHHAMVALIHRQQAERRDYRRNRSPVDLLSDEELAAAAPCVVVPDDSSAIDRQLDVQTLLERLPAELRQACELLQTHSVAAAARELGIPESTLRARLKKVRAAFVAAGWDTNLDSFSRIRVRSQYESFQGEEMNRLQNRTECFIREPAEAYHERSGEYLTSHLLADFRKCPQLYRQKTLGLILDEDRPAYVVGRAVHTLALEGRERFDDEYAIGGPINEKTGQPYGANTKAFSEWAATHGKSVLTDPQYALVNAMAMSVRAHDQARRLLADGIAEGVVRTEYCGVPVQSRLDWFDPHQGIVDLKTCDDLTWFEADARRFGYAHQMAFYRAVVARVVGVSMPVFFIAVEKKEPFRCGVWKLDADTLALAQQDNEAAIERLKQCQETDEWPTGYEEVRVFECV